MLANPLIAALFTVAPPNVMVWLMPAPPTAREAKTVPLFWAIVLVAKVLMFAGSMASSRTPPVTRIPEASVAWPSAVPVATRSAPPETWTSPTKLL